MDHLPEVLKILEGALRSNAELSVSYARALIEKLENEGLHQQARLLQRKLDMAPARMVPLLSGGVGSVPVDQESRLDLADVEIVGKDEPPVLLDAHIRMEVERFLSDVRNMDRLMAAGLPASPRMLIFGPPGVGKTQLARYIAGQLSLPLITARCDSLISSFLGNTAKNIRHLFDHASLRPCVLFLDEFDALAKARDDSQELGELKRVVVGLLQNIDSMPAQSPLIAATNHEQLLDPAVWRRFNYRLEIHLPTAEVRAALMRSYLGRYAPDSSLIYAVRLSEGLSGGLIRHAVEDTIRTAVLSEQESVTDGELVSRLAKIVLNARRQPPTTDAVVNLLLQESVPLRMISEGTGVSMRQLLKHGRETKNSEGKSRGIHDKQGKPRSRR